MRLLVDSSVLIDLLRNRRGRRHFVAGLVRAGHSLMTSSINVAEIHAGMRDEEHDRTEQLIAGLECLTLTASIAKYAGDLKREWSRRGRTLTLADTIVAATALEHGCAVVTDNQKDFPMSELQLYPLPS